MTNGPTRMRLAVGAAQLLAAPLVAGLESSQHPDAVTVRAFRVLGARQLVQGVLRSSFRSRRARVISGSVDVLHAASMFLLAVADSGRRRPALLEGLFALLFASRELRRRPAPPSGR